MRNFLYREPFARVNRRFSPGVATRTLTDDKEKLKRHVDATHIGQLKGVIDPSCPVCTKLSAKEANNGE